MTSSLCGRREMEELSMFQDFCIEITGWLALTEEEIKACHLTIPSKSPMLARSSTQARTMMPGGTPHSYWIK